MISKEELEAVNHIRDYIIELEEEIKDLKEINAEHQKLNGELQKKLTKLEKEKHIWDLTKIACCNAQNCEALNNAIREGLENEKLREENSKLKEIIEGKSIQELGMSDLYKED